MTIYPTKAAMVFLEKELALPATGREQDWDVELADWRRLDEFISYFETHLLDSDVQVALMSLILASLDDLLHEADADPPAENRVVSLLRKHQAVFRSLAERWNRDRTDTDDFLVSRVVRRALS